MPLYRMLRGDTSFDPEEIEIIAGAYEDALIILQLSEENLPMRELLATRILSMATAGERSRTSLCNRAVMSIKSSQ